MSKWLCIDRNAKENASVPKAVRIFQFRFEYLVERNTIAS